MTHDKPDRLTFQVIGHNHTDIHERTIERLADYLGDRVAVRTADIYVNVEGEHVDTSSPGGYRLLPTIYRATVTYTPGFES